MGLQSGHDDSGSLLGFAVGGTFLSLLYFDVPYYLMGPWSSLVFWWKKN